MSENLIKVSCINANPLHHPMSATRFGLLTKERAYMTRDNFVEAFAEQGTIVKVSQKYGGSVSDVAWLREYWELGPKRPRRAPAQSSLDLDLIAVEVWRRIEPLLEAWWLTRNLASASPVLLPVTEEKTLRGLDGPLPIVVGFEVK